jgi:hypothetical protein
MKTSFYSMTKRFAASVITAIAACAFASTASADTIDFGEMHLDSVYSVTANSITGTTYKGYFIAPSDGTAVFHSTSSSSKPGVYLTEDLSTQAGATGARTSTGGWEDNLKVTAGTKYYICKKYAYVDNQFSITMGQKMEAAFYPQLTYPSKFSAAGEALVTLQCNMAPAWDKITISSKGNTAELTGTVRQSTYVEISLKSVLTDWYSKGLVGSNDYITVTVSGLRSANDASVVYGEDGTISVSYCLAAAPANLVSMTSLDGSHSLNVAGSSTDYVVYSYFLESDQSAIFKAVFDQPLDPTAGSAEITFGSVEGADGEYYVETIPLTFENDNKTAILNLTGKSRRLQEMIKSGTDYANMALSLSHLKDVDGNYINTSAQGSSGTITWNVKYKQLAGDITIYYMPESMNLAGEEYAEVYVMNYENLIWSGVSLANKTIYKSFTKDQLTIETDKYGGAYIQTPLTDELRKAKNLVFTITDAASRTGQDLSTIATCTYNVSSVDDDKEEETITYVGNLNIVSTPAMNAFVESCSEVYLTFSDYEVAAFDITDGKYATIQKQNGDLVQITSEDSYKYGTGYNELKLLLGELAATTGSYHVTFPKGIIVLDDEGLVRNEEFTISFVVDEPTTYVKDIKFTSTPANGSEVESCSVIDIIFPDYGTVGTDNNIYTTIQCEGGEAVKVNDYEFGTGWNEMLINLGDNAVEEGKYTVTFGKGLFILEDNDKMLTDEFSMTFTVKKASTAPVQERVTVPAEGSSVSALNKVEITYTNIAKEVYYWPTTANTPVLYKDGVVYLTPNCADNNNVVSANFGHTVNEYGTYRLNVPANCINLDGKYVDEFDVNFNIGASGVENIEITGPGAEYFDLNGIKVTTPEAGKLYITREGDKVSKVLVK